MRRLPGGRKRRSGRPVDGSSYGEADAATSQRRQAATTSRQSTPWRRQRIPKADPRRSWLRTRWSLLRERALDPSWLRRMIIGMMTALYLKKARKMARYLWSYRLEIALGVAVFTLFWIASAMPLWLSIPTWLVVFGLGVWKRKNLLPRTREMHQSAKVRRQLQRAAKDAGFGELYVDKVTSTLPGEWAKVRVPRGQTVEDLDRVSKKLRGNMKVTDVRVIPDRDNPSGAASVSIVRRDPFENIGGYEW